MGIGEPKNRTFYVRIVIWDSIYSKLQVSKQGCENITEDTGSNYTN